MHSLKYKSIIRVFNKEEKEIANKVFPFFSFYIGQKSIRSHLDTKMP